MRVSFRIKFWHVVIVFLLALAIGYERGYESGYAAARPTTEPVE